MANQPLFSSKRLAIVKTNGKMVSMISVASFVTIFSLMAAKSVFSQISYQSRVIAADQQTNRQLSSDISSANKLVSSYKSFVSQPTNVIGGNSQTTGGNNGDNAKIILDALPSQYDFPALATSLENILNSVNVQGDISGTDQQLTQQTNQSSTSPQAVAMPFNVDTKSISYSSAQQLIDRLESSIRPIQIDSLQMTGGSNNMTVSISAHTYYQPAKKISITTKVIQ